MASTFLKHNFVAVHFIKICKQNNIQLFWNFIFWVSCSAVHIVCYEECGLQEGDTLYAGTWVLQLGCFCVEATNYIVSTVISSLKFVLCETYCMEIKEHCKEQDTATWKKTSSAPKIEVACSPETFETVSRTTWHHIAEHSNPCVTNLHMSASFHCYFIR
jgi:hypothetical protein